MNDVIDTLAGIAPGSRLDTIRTLRPEARKHAQMSYLGLFEPAHAGGVSAQERFAVASFVAGLHGRPETSTFYSKGLASCGASPALQAAVAACVAAAKTSGPYGSYPKGPLSVENTAGPIYRVAADTRPALGARLAAAFEHVHMLVFHPRDAAPPSLQSVLDAGWSTTDVVTLSQLVAFLSFQIRVVAGLRTLAPKLSA
ncbi:MAG: CMD domain protein [Reyranellales bacterium]